MQQKQCIDDLQLTITQQKDEIIKLTEELNETHHRIRSSMYSNNELLLDNINDERSYLLDGFRKGTKII